MKHPLKEQRSESQPMSVAQVQQRLEEISAHRALLVQSRISLDQRLESVQEETARKYLRGDRSGLQEVNAITAELQAIEGALALLDSDEQMAQTELKRAEARELRSQAAVKRAELDRLNAETAPLLAKLSQLEGVSYTRSVLSSQPVLRYRNVLVWNKPLTCQAPDEHQGVTELALNHPAPHWERVAMPHSRKILAEAEALEQQARQIEEKLSQAA